VDDHNHQSSFILSSNTDRITQTAPTCSKNIDYTNRNRCSSQSYRKIDEQPPRSYSLETISFSPLRETTTDDSGTGDSVIHLPAETTAEPLHYEIVPIYGQPMVALMANRYEFDPTKVAEYKLRKRIIPGPLFGKSGHNALETTPKPNRQTSNESKKSPNLVSRLLRKFKSSPTNEIPWKPMVRHHSSSDIIDGNH